VSVSPAFSLATQSDRYPWPPGVADPAGNKHADRPASRPVSRFSPIAAFAPWAAQVQIDAHFPSRISIALTQREGEGVGGFETSNDIPWNPHSAAADIAHKRE